MLTFNKNFKNIKLISIKDIPDIVTGTKSYLKFITLN